MSYIEAIYIDTDGQARKTLVGCECDTPADTWATFNAARAVAVPLDRADFLLDYHNRKGDLADTIGVSREGFEEVTGERALSDAEYRAIDREFWDDVRAEMPA